jgi:hypothetical protein
VADIYRTTFKTGVDVFIAARRPAPRHRGRRH